MKYHFRRGPIAFILLLTLCPGKPALAGEDVFDKAVSLYKQKNYRAAAPLFSQVMNSHPESPTAVYYEGLCYQQLGDIEHAKNFYRNIMTNFPQSAEAKLAGSVLKAYETAGNSNATAAGSGTAGGTISKLSSPQIVMSRITTQDLPKDPAAAMGFCKRVQLSDEEWRELPDDVKVPFYRYSSSHLFVDGYVNGRSIRLMFDTGAENCHFGKPELAKAGVRFEQGGPQIPVGGVAGTEMCGMMMADVTIGGITRHLPILVSERSVGCPIVGESFFKEYRYEIDNSQGFIHFIKKSRKGMPVSAAYESTDVIKIPFQNSGNNMVVRVKVNGREIPMFFDTGASSITFSALHAAALGLHVPADAQIVGVSGAGGMVRGYMFPVDRIELGPIIKTHVTVIVNQAATPPLPLLGQPFYKDRRFTIDNDNHVIKFAH